MHPSIKIRIAPTAILICVAACGGAQLPSAPIANVSQSITSGPMPTLPTESGTGALVPWGGSDSSRWRPEAILANASSEALNQAWSLPKVRDAIVAVPVRMHDSSFSEFGDGQDNAAPSFEWWSGTHPPVVATLVHFNDGTPSKVLFRFSSMLPVSGSFEVSYKINGRSSTVALISKKNARGDWTAEWIVPSELGWSSLLSEQMALVHPAGWSDWFPLWFRIPVRPIADLKATVPTSQQTFSDGKDIVDHEGVSLQTSASTTQSPFSRLFARTFSAAYNQTPYNPADIHARYPSNGNTTVTGVGQGWTWVASAPAAPFKIMYTCFQRRQAGAEASATDGGVASGGGWHSIGDPAETILNDLETGPIVVGSSMSNPYLVSQLDSGGFAYNLTDVVVIRWLQPGEAFITRRGGSIDDGFGNTLPQTNYHWYFFHQAREVCTEEWVHPTVPDDAYDFGANSEVTFQVNASTVWGENVYVVGDVSELGGWGTSRAVRLTATNYPTWSGSISMAQGEIANFKFVKIDTNGTVTWERGANRRLVVPAATTSLFTGSWQVR